jgi:transposase
MKAPIFVRPLTGEERQRIQTGLRSSDAFVLRRCQIVLASARGERAIAIAQQLGCDDQTVRNVIKQFNTDGLGVLQAGSSRPHRLRTVMDAQAMQHIPAILHRSPRDFGKEQSLWSLHLLAQVCFEQGLTSRVLTIEGMRKILRRLGLNWKRAKHWITSPDAQYELKKTLVTD